MTPIANYRALLACFEAKSEEVKWHFMHLRKLISDGLPCEIALAYAFFKVEQGQNRALYGGVVRIHRCDAEFARRLMNFQHLTRDGFQQLYRNVFGQSLKTATVEKLKIAEKTRDKVIHGKDISQKELREAIADVLAYAEAFNDEVYSIAQFKPFAKMRGFKGRAASLDKRTSKWLMRGLGFGVKA